MIPYTKTRPSTNKNDFDRYDSILSIDSVSFISYDRCDGTRETEVDRF